MMLKNRVVNMVRNKAFTLVELLVVISIIALLLSILMPSLNSARQQGQSVVCGFRLRALGTSMEMYAMDNRGHYPYFRNSYPDAQGNPPLNNTQGRGYWVRWFHMLAPTEYNGNKSYISVTNVEKSTLNFNERKDWRDVFTCPTAYSKKIAAAQYSYVPNFWILTSHKSNVPTSKLSRISGEYCSFKKESFSQASSTPMLMDGQTAGSAFYSFRQLPPDTLIDAIQPAVQGRYGPGDPLGPFGFMDQIGRMHKNAGNWVFLDGHVGKVPFKANSELSKSYSIYASEYNWLPNALK